MRGGSRRARLGEVAEFIRGITFKPEDLVAGGTDDAVVCMRTKNVQTLLDEADILTIPKSFVRREEQFLGEGDLLMSTANSWNLVGKACWVPSLSYSATAGGFISILRANKEVVDPRYLYYWTTSPETQAALRNCGRQTTNISNLDFRRAESLEIPLPGSIAEQKRLAAILDHADGIRRKRQQALRLADEFLRSVFLDMFGDPVANPKGWPRKSLEMACSWVVDCPHTTPRWTEAGEICLRTSNLGDGIFIWDDKRYVSEDEHFERSRRLELKCGDIVLSREGTVGIAAIVPPGTRMSMGQRLVQLRPDDQFMRSQFLLRLILWVLDPTRIGQVMVGSTSKHLNVGELRKLNIISPPLALQKEFDQVACFTSRNRERQLLAAAESETLFQSLQHRAFSGQL